ncbi:MAG: serine acetyltransferase [Proteobacteria bacterium]|nr:serine acetyltransferase [Pseudomonadota bacterium]
MQKTLIAQVVEDTLSTYEKDGGINHIEGPNLPSREGVTEIVTNLLHVIFPGYYEKQELSKADVTFYIWEKIVSVYHNLSREVFKSLRYDPKRKHLDDESLSQQSVEITINLLHSLPKVREKLSKDVEAAYEGDPAAKSFNEVILSYPGLEAVTIYRIAHELHIQQVPLIPRIMTEFAHTRTGIDIHPGAEIGEYFFIDHGTGVVIGETCQIGNNVRIYQGVTLGALSFKKDKDGKLVKGIKRHPTIEDNVIIYAGATILGGDTLIGKNSVVGGNVWLVESVPPNTTVTLKFPELTYSNQKT